MGTTYSVTAIEGSKSLDKAEVQSAINVALQSVDAQMSNWRNDSEISRFNAQTGTQQVAVSPELHEVMQAAEYVNNASLGRFDTTLGPLIELWGFGASGGQKLPSDSEIALQKNRSGHGNTLEMSHEGLRKTRPDAQIYLAGIGKGYGADRVGHALEGLGVKNYMVEIGGDIYAKGVNPDGQPWQIGIESPSLADRSLFGVVGLSGMGLATSGDYRNFFEVDGQRFSHLIDPTTGRPVTHSTVSATVLAENAMLADAWSTGMLILGHERGLEVARAQGIAVQFISRGAETGSAAFQTHESDKFKALTA